MWLEKLFYDKKCGVDGVSGFKYIFEVGAFVYNAITIEAWKVNIRSEGCFLVLVWMQRHFQTFLSVYKSAYIKVFSKPNPQGVHSSQDSPSIRCKSDICKSWTNHKECLFTWDRWADPRQFCDKISDIHPRLKRLVYDPLWWLGFPNIWRHEFGPANITAKQMRTML